MEILSKAAKELRLVFSQEGLSMRNIDFLWSKGLINKDEAIFLCDCLSEGGIPECFGRFGIQDRCFGNRWVRGYRLCRICEKLSEYGIECDM